VTKDLQGKTVLVTGGSRGLGRGMAERLAQAGALVAVNYASNAEAAADTVRAIEAAGGQAFALKAHLGAPGADDALVDALLTGLEARTGRRTLDILVNNIGGGLYGRITDITPEVYDETFSNNVRAPFFLTQKLIPHLADGGRIINISSAASRLAGVDFIVYSMSKAALDMFTKVLAKDLGPAKRITVNSVLPGFNATETNAHLVEDETARKQIEAMTALGRFGQPEDIAEVVHFLASPAGRWVTGQIIEASGGFNL
jgi:NAD(P)-dependent dehydrogenase (short-subunit alcohol dehydrogenase family)